MNERDGRHFLARTTAKHYVADADHGGWIEANAALNFWQIGNTRNLAHNNVVTACVQAYAQTIAQLPALHLREEADGYAAPVRASALSRVMWRPNAYQTRSDFLLNLVSSLMYNGNAYAIASRDARFTIEALHLVPPHACTAHVIEGEIFYHVAPDAVSGIGQAMLVPAREMLHVRLYTPHDPLRGETPLAAAAQAVAVNNNLMGHQATFFGNMTRPSGVITTDEKLDAEQTAALRRRWEEQSKGLNSGGVPILAWGLKWQPLSLSNQDAQLIEALKFSVEDIARAYRVPLPIIGVVDGASYNNVYNLLSFWKASGLGFVIEHIEQAIGRLFDLAPGEKLELDTDNLLRTDMVARIDALTKGITGGLYAPNEGRRLEGLRPVDGGEMPRVQQQMVPLDYTEPAPVAPPAEPVKTTMPPRSIRREIEELMAW